MVSIERLLYLLAISQATSEDKARLREWASGHPDREELLEKLSDPGFVGREMELNSMVNVDRAMEDMRRRIETERRRHLFSWRHLAAAAVIALLIGVGGAFLFTRNVSLEPQPTAEAVVYTTDSASFNVYQPGITHAVLTADNGDAHLELGANDTVIASSALAVTLASRPDDVARTRELCLDVPRGAEFKIRLEDSTEVWLNAESTLRYPETFDEGERRVSLTGEAYFVVHHEDNRPFYVDTREQTIKVYGTEFNVRVYDDDPFVYTTLARGSISISRRDYPGGEVMLSPGLQARLDRDKLELDLRKVNATAVTSWRNKRFVFEEQPLSAIMRDLSRWYNFEYEFTSPEVENIIFKGSIPRYADFATACSIIEMSGGLKFLMKEGKILVTLQKSE